MLWIVNKLKEELKYYVSSFLMLEMFIDWRMDSG